MNRHFLRTALARMALGAALGVLAASPAHAQATGKGGSARDYATEAERLRAQVDALKSQRQRLEMDGSAMRIDVDSVLRAIGPQLERAYREAARAQASLANKYGAQIENDAELSRLVRDLGQVQGLAQMELAQRARRLRSEAPRGYLGISYSGAVREQTRNGDVVLWHDDAPVVVSVEPGSPAERAGIRRGDTLVSYNGAVLRRRSVALNEMLKPGRTVEVKLRRAGEDRTVKVTVGRRPQAYVVGPQGPGSDVGFVFSTPDELMPMTPMAPMVAPPPMPAATPRVRVYGASPTPMVAPMAPNAPVGVWVFGGTSLAVGGAQVVALDDNWRDLLGGVEEGLVVVKVAAGTPASAAGLRSGDVIVSADGQTVRTPIALQRAVESSDDRRVSLGVIRKRESRTVTLRW